ncbi:hypothetical protein OEZ86_006137 [Tetradesmus obliquus]|nr:hypothetical protein OEZ86_006137 [Tetradesmus obliquus]
MAWSMLRSASGSGFASQIDNIEEWAGYSVGIERAVTLPASWYTSPLALQLEKQHVLYNSWQMVCDVGRLQQPGDFVCGSLADVRYLIVRGEDGQLRAFHNVCRHHAAAVAQGCGNQLQFQCPYHGWTYDDKGRLVKATRLKGIKDFKATQFGLHPIALDVWGHFVFLHLQGGKPAAAAAAAAAGGQQGQLEAPSVADWLGAGGVRLQECGMADSQLLHVARREYVLGCNWKVFCDNYLDGGYHVPYAHADLASGLDLSGYTNELHEVLSIQSCSVKQGSSSSSSEESSGSSSSSEAQLDRLAGGRDAAYAFVYPNLMINRYGPWMDTNVVLPYSGSSTDRCRVVFDYWLDAAAVQQAAATVQGSSSSSSSSSSADRDSSCSTGGGSAAGSSSGGSLADAAVVATARQSAFVRDSLASSHKVQEEDSALCEAVQLGLQEPAYGVGRYAPGPEAPMYHFHRLLYGAVMRGVQEQQ